MPFTTKPSPRALFAALTLCAFPAYATPVTEIKPDQLAAYIARNDLVVLQLTSPDPKCRYCIGADKTFDQAAAEAKNPAMKFVRIQWPVWHKMPSLAPLLDNGGIPRQVIFKGGKEMRSAGGRPDNAASLLADIDHVLTLPPAPGKTYDATQKQAQAGPAHTPMTAAQQEFTRLMIRKDFFTSVTSACGRMFPQQAEQYKKALEQWQAPRKDKLNQASMLMVTRSSREDAAETSALVELEKKVLQSWQVDKLGIPMTRAPDLKDCDKLAASLDKA